MNDKVNTIQLWRKKEQALQSIYLITIEMSKAISKEDTRRVDRLLLRRQNLMEQVDSVERRLSEKKTIGCDELDLINESIRQVGKKIQSIDDCNKKLVLTKHDEYKKSLRVLGKQKQGMKAYIMTTRQVDGMYFDTKK